MVSTDDEGIKNEEQDDVLWGTLNEKIDLAESVPHAVGNIHETTREQEFQN